MVVTFLGTGTSQGVPVIGCDCPVCRSLDFRDKRLRVAVHLAVAGRSLIIDTAPDFRQQMLRERIQTVDALLLTHQHKDHTAGLDDIRAYNYRQGIDMPVFGRPEVLDQLKTEFAYAFAEVKYPGSPQLALQPIQNQIFEAAGIPVTPIEVMHYQLPVYGFRVGNFTYITDANFIADEELEKVKGSEVVVLNALQQEPHISHFTLEEALAVLEKLQPERAYLTHISHRMGCHAAVDKHLPPNVRLAYDGLQVKIAD